jgi:ABC-type branched-subunit amino acid transport system ATPase component/ABC-type branched-subunit amino acid transport system permease subunit
MPLEEQIVKFAILGIGSGALYVLMAQALVLVYRGSGIINFAQGAFGMAAAYLYFAVFKNEFGWPSEISMPLALLFVAVGGALVYLAIARQLKEASNLTRTVATLGVLIALQTVVVICFDPSKFLAAIGPLPNGDIKTITLFGTDYLVGANRLWLIGIAIVVTVALWALSRFTVLGLATSAAAENEESASALGWSPELIGAVNWALGAVLAGAACIFATTVNGVTGLAAAPLIFLVVPGLAVALIGEFRSFPAAFFAGMLLGIVESELQLTDITNFLTDHNIPQQGVAKALPFFVIVIVLMLRGKGLPLRSHIFDRLPMLGTGRVNLKAIGIAVVVLALALGPFQLNTDWIQALTATAIAAVLVLSLVVLTGYTGQISLAQYALAGLAAWSSSRLVAAEDWPFELAIVAGIATAVLIGLVFAIPALRTRGISLAIVTLGLGVAAQQLVWSNEDWIGGPTGTNVATANDHLRFLGIDIDSSTHPTNYLIFVLVAVTLLTLMVASVRRSRSGRRLIAVRTNERAAAALGISVFGAKMYAFAIASGIAGIGGILLAFRDRQVNFAGTFDPINSIELLAFAVIGGIGFIAATVAGGTFAQGGVQLLGGTKLFDALDLGPDFFRYFGLITAFSLFAVILIAPDGIVALAIKRRDDRRALRAAKTGRPLPAPRAEPLPEAEATRMEPRALEISGLSVRFGGVVALDRVDVRVEPGKVVGLIGPNGAGKTTLVDAATGFVRPAEGTITLDGIDIGGLPTHRRVRAGMSRSFQSLELFEDLTVRDNLRAAADRRDSKAYLTNLVRPANEPLRPAVIAAIHEFGLEPDLDRRPTDLSFGRRRLVAIARAVAVAPSVLLLDEPAAGLGDSETRELAELVRRLADDWGMGVLVIEHDMSFVMSLCDHLVVLDFGREIASGPPVEIQRDPDVIRAYLGGGDEATLGSSARA